MTFTDAAAEVLRLLGRPLHYKEITDIAIEKNLLSHVGKSPEVTMGARLAATLKKDSAENPLVRVKPGVFALREWDDKTIKAGLEPKRGAKKAPRAEAEPVDDGGYASTLPAHTASNANGPATAAADAEGADEVLIATDDAEEVVFDEEPAALESADNGNAAELAAAPSPASAPSAPHASHTPHTASRGRTAPPDEEPEEVEAIEAEPPGPDDVMRAEAAAGAAEMFDEEEDDDQPILGGTDDRAPAPGADQGDGRRRRRRRRRGRTNGEAPAPTGGLPSYTATPAFEGRDNVRSDAGRDVPNREGGRDSNRDGSRDNRREPDRRDRDLPQGQAQTGREPAGEAVYRPQVIELTGGEGHALDDLAGRELSDAVAVILATFDRNAGAVSLRQIAETAQRRGRLAGDAQLVQSQVAAAVRADNARRLTAGQRPRFRLAGGRVALTDWLLSGDLARLEQEALAAVERYRDAARRAFARKLGELPGHAFVEICVLALEKVGVSQIRALRRAGVPGGESHFSGVLRAAAADELRLAIVLRRDGREVGRERVADLRGSLHHYGPAHAGWVFTAGQMLSGAREEAAVPGTAPIALFDGLAVARLCEDNDVAVIRARLPIAIPDVDLLEALRAS
jgi:hypothetical protein